MENPSSGSEVHLKHRLSKREYKVVLSKTYVGDILLMHMYQGKGRWGSLAEVPDLTWLVLNYCCLPKPTGEQRRATRRAGRLPGLLVGPGPSGDGPQNFLHARPGDVRACHLTYTWSGR